MAPPRLSRLVAFGEDGGFVERFGDLVEVDSRLFQRALQFARLQVRPGRLLRRGCRSLRRAACRIRRRQVRRTSSRATSRAASRRRPLGRFSPLQLDCSGRPRPGSSWGMTLATAVASLGSMPVACRHPWPGSAVFPSSDWSMHPADVDVDIGEAAARSVGDRALEAIFAAERFALGGIDGRFECPFRSGRGRRYSPIKPTALSSEPPSLNSTPFVGDVLRRLLTLFGAFVDECLRPQRSSWFRSRSAVRRVRRPPVLEGDGAPFRPAKVRLPWRSRAIRLLREPSFQVRR